MNESRSGDEIVLDGMVADGFDDPGEPLGDPRRWRAAVGLLRVLNPELHNRLLEMVEAAASKARRVRIERMC